MSTNIVSKVIATSIIALVLTVAAFVVSQPAYAENTIAITDQSLTIDVDSTVTLYLSGQSTDAVSWESSNTDAATIKSSTSRKAVIIGAGKGSSNIIATDENGNKATCTVTVKMPDFEITSNQLMVVEETTKINVNVGSAIAWNSSNSDIVSIQDKGSSSATVKAESVGTAIITATDKYGSESNCTVRVRQERFEVMLSNGYDENGNLMSCDMAEFSSYWAYQSHDEWNSDYGYYESYGYYDKFSYYEVHPIYGTISKCTSGNNNIAFVSKADGYYLIYPKGVGTTKITCTDPYGETESFTCKVTLNYFIEKETQYTDGDNVETWKYYSYRNLKYGSGKLTGVTYNSAKVTAIINGKNYTGKADINGNYSISVPKYIKLNTGITIKASQYGVTKTVKRTVVSNRPPGSATYNTNGRSLKMTVKNVHKGDYIKIKVGKKTYTKKIKKDQKKIKYTVKTKKLKRGTKVKITIFNKFKQELISKSFKIK